jgi:hypothetical protein
MEIINDGINRGVLDCDDMFMKFVSKDGMGLSEYPTIIFLTNRLFLKDEDRIGSHVNITETLKLKDDFRWYKIMGKDNIKQKISDALTDKGTFKNIDFFEEDTDSEHRGISHYWYSGTIHYMNSNNTLKSSKTGPFDKEAKTIIFPNGGNLSDAGNAVIDICQLNSSSDLILTKTRLYRYDYANNTLVTRLEISDATAMCRTASYFIITCTNGGGFFIITNIDSSDETALSYKKPIYISYPSIVDPDTQAITSEGGDNGLSPSNSYTYCLPIGGNTIEINGKDNKNCLFNCASWMSDNSGYEAPESMNPKGIKSCHYNNEAILFTVESAFDASKNIYPMKDGNSFFKYDKYMMFIGKETEEPNKTALYLYSNFTTQASKKAVITTEDNKIPHDLTSGYIKDLDTIFLFSSSGKTYKVIGKDNTESSFALFPIAFDYEKDHTAKEACVNKIILVLSDLIDLINNDGQERWSKVNDRDTNFLFIRLALNSGKACWYGFGDDNRRDTTFKDMAEAFDIG